MSAMVDSKTPLVEGYVIMMAASVEEWSATCKFLLKARVGDYLR